MTWWPPWAWIPASGKSEVSRICADLGVDVAAFQSRSLDAQAFPYVFVDATYCKARVGGDAHGKGARVASQAVVIATGVSADGRREVLGSAVGDWRDRGLLDRVPPWPARARPERGAAGDL